MRDFEARTLRVHDLVVVADYLYEDTYLSRGVVKEIDPRGVVLVETATGTRFYAQMSIMKTGDGNVITASFLPRNGPGTVPSNDVREPFREECDLLVA